MSNEQTKRLTKAFNALSNPNRLQLFMNLLAESRLDLVAGRVHDCFLSGLLRNLKIGAPTVSHHVKELENAELITTHRDGKHLVCSINPDMIRQLKTLFPDIA